jgi:hypothetical protein
MTPEEFQKKLKRWERFIPKKIKRGLKKLAREIQNDALQEYAGGTVNVLTGRTKRAIKSDAKKTSAGIFVDTSRAFIARFHESGTVKMRKNPVWEKLREKYRSKIAQKLLQGIMEGYK